MNTSAAERRREAVHVDLEVGTDGPRFTVDQVRTAAAHARDLEFRKQGLEEQLADVKYQLRTMYWRTLPEMMEGAGVDQVGVAAEGNLSAFDLTLEEHVSANIGVNWTPERRNAAIRWLEDNGHADLVKTEVVTEFPREARDEAVQFVERSTANLPLGAEVSVRETVNPMTLRAWLRREMKAGRQLPPLDLIGAAIARVAKLKKREE
jgi:transposase-like protein